MPEAVLLLLVFGSEFENENLAGARHHIHVPVRGYAEVRNVRVAAVWHRRQRELVLVA